LKLQKLLKAVSSSLTVDPGLAGSGLLTFASQIEDLSAGNVTFATIPIEGTPTISVDGSPLSIVQIDPARVRTFVQAAIGAVTTPTNAYAKVVAAAPSTVQVKVVNAGGVDGAATAATEKLAALGFNTLSPGSDASSSTTTISYPAGMEAQAKALAKYVPGAQITAGGSGTSLTLTLGQDGLAVGAPASSTTHPASTTAAAPKTSTSASSTADGSPKAFSAGECIN
jgi:hypothetical protein